MVRNVSNLNAGEPIWSKHTKDVHDDPALVLGPELRLELRTQIRAQTSLALVTHLISVHHICLFNELKTVTESLEEDPVVST